MIVYEPVSRLPTALAPRLLPCIARECSRLRAKTRTGKWLIGLRFVSRSAIRRLNRVYRGKDCETDVLSFSALQGNPSFPKHRSIKELGDIVICTSVARSQAKRRAIDLREELVRLVVHGTLHLLGYDHTDARKEERMLRTQETIVESIEPISKILSRLQKRLFRPCALQDSSKYLDIPRRPSGHRAEKFCFWPRKLFLR